MLTALALRLGFEEGLFDRNDVADWVGDQVERADSVPSALLELVPIVGLDDADIEALLRELAGPVACEVESRVRIDVLCHAYRSGRLDVRALALHLSTVAITDSESLPEEVWWAASGLHDALLLADAGQYGTVAEAEADVIAFVEEVGRPIVEDVPPGTR